LCLGVVGSSPFPSSMVNESRAYESFANLLFQLKSFALDLGRSRSECSRSSASNALTFLRSHVLRFLEIRLEEAWNFRGFSRLSHNAIDPLSPFFPPPRLFPLRSGRRQSQIQTLDFYLMVNRRRVGIFGKNPSLTSEE